MNDSGIRFRFGAPAKKAHGAKFSGKKEIRIEKQKSKRSSGTSPKRFVVLEYDVRRKKFYFVNMHKKGMFDFFKFHLNLFKLFEMQFLTLKANYRHSINEAVTYLTIHKLQRNKTIVGHFQFQ